MTSKKAISSKTSRGKGLAALRALLTDPVRAAVEQISEQRTGCDPSEFALESAQTVRIVLAYSGGRDSSALLDVLARLYKNKCATRIASLTVVHIHHGLSAHADEWAEHAKAACAKYKLPLIVEKVYVNPHSSMGVEAAARQARYRALMNIAKNLKADMIMTAHHLDDRVETFLIQWMRGAGPDGLSAMTPARPMEALSEEDNQIVLARPWLDVSAQDIADYAKKAHLTWVEDDSNSDSRYLRNLIRNEVLPILDSARSGWRVAAARSVSLVADAAQLARHVSEVDLAQCIGKKPQTLNIIKLLGLPIERQALCLRAWLAEFKLKAPSRARTVDILRQLRESQNDNKLAIRVENKEIRRWMGELVLRDPDPTVKPADILTKTIVWQGEESVSLGVWGGELRFHKCAPDEEGISAERLKSGKLEVRPRKGGEKLKLHRLRPSKNLKHIFQAQGVASFDRSRLPCVWLDNELVFVAGLGTDVREHADKDLVLERIRLEWVPDKPLISI